MTKEILYRLEIASDSGALSDGEDWLRKKGTNSKYHKKKKNFIVKLMVDDRFITSESAKHVGF